MPYNQNLKIKLCYNFSPLRRSGGEVFERICSKLGGGLDKAIVPVDSSVIPIEGPYATRAGELQDMVLRNMDCVNINSEYTTIDSHFSIIDDLKTANNQETDLYFYHSDHLGSSSFITDADGIVSQHLQYLPYGELFAEQRDNTARYYTPYKFSAKEKDEETSYSYFGARYYMSDVSVWLSVDPMTDKYPHLSPYNYCENSPIILVDPDGCAPGDPIPGHYQASVKSRMIAFALRHPIAAGVIGTPLKGSTNISTNSVRFSTRIGLNENTQHEGSQVNAFRHALWQAKITQEFGTSIAKQVGNLHEENPYAVNGSNFSTSFSTLAKADETIDLMNNIIGRSIGNANPNANMQELAIKILEYYKENGLWTATAVTNDKGEITGYTISQTKLSQEQFDVAKLILQRLNANGFTPAEQASRDRAAQEAAKARAEALSGPKF